MTFINRALGRGTNYMVLVPFVNLLYTVLVQEHVLTCMVCIFRLLFFVLQFIATYFGGGIIITISLHTYMCYLQ